MRLQTYIKAEDYGYIEQRARMLGVSISEYVKRLIERDHYFSKDEYKSMRIDKGKEYDISRNGEFVKSFVADECFLIEPHYERAEDDTWREWIEENGEYMVFVE